MVDFREPIFSAILYDVTSVKLHSQVPKRLGGYLKLQITDVRLNFIYYQLSRKSEFETLDINFVFHNRR